MADSTEIAGKLYEALGNMSCSECEHKLKYHIDKYGCEYERGDGYIGDAEYLKPWDLVDATNSIGEMR